MEPGSTYTCQSGFNDKAVHAAGGWIWTSPKGWNPGGNFQSFFIGSASCPFQMKLSLSPTILTSTRLALTCRSSRSSRRITTCPAVPPRIRVSLWMLTAIFWIPSRGSSLKGSYVPTYIDDKAMRSRSNWSIDSLIDWSADSVDQLIDINILLNIYTLLFMHELIDSLIDWSADSVDQLIHWLIYWFVDSLNYRSTDLFNDCLIDFLYIAN